MTHADLLELAAYHDEQARYNQHVANFIRVPAVKSKHDDRAAWHRRHADGLRAMADAFITAFPETATIQNPS